MKTIRKWLNCVCVCVNVTLLLVFPFNSFSQEQVAAPVYNDGDFWVFRITNSDRRGTSSARREGEYQVAYAGSAFKVSRLVGEETGAVESFGGDLRGMLGIDSENKQFQYLQFPLIVGQTWTRDYQYVGSAGRGGSRLRRRTARQGVVGVEQITTPAGTFQTLKIESEPIGTIGDGEVLVLLYHYSPETKSIVKFRMNRRDAGGSLGTTEIELIKFGTAP